MIPTPTQVIDLLVSLRQIAHGALYPPEMLAARRAAFVAQLHDPADCSGIETDDVTEAEDERNSRLFHISEVKYHR